MEHIEFQGKQYHLVCGGCGVKLTYEIVDGDYVVAPHECIIREKLDVPPVNPVSDFGKLNAEENVTTGGSFTYSRP